MLELLFGSLIKVRLLKLFIRNDGLKFTQSEIVKRLQVSSSSLKSHLKQLLETGFLKSSLKRNERFFSINKKFIVYLELQDLIGKIGLPNEKELLNEIKKLGQIQLVILSGVFVNSNQSRVDILIVGDRIRKDKTNLLFKKLESEIGKELDYVVLKTKEFKYRRGMFDRFLRDILDFPHKKLINKLRV